MSLTKRNHYNPCFWTALWNAAYYQGFTLGNTRGARARDQVVHVLNVKSQKIYPTTVDRVHYDKNLGIAEITRAAIEDFARRYHPDQYKSFVADNEAASYPVYLDFESILTGLETTPAYQIMMKVAQTQVVDTLVEKIFLASFVVLQHLRSHSIMNAMIDWNEEMGYQKFEHLVTLKWMLSDTELLFQMINPLVAFKWSLYSWKEPILPLCDSAVLVQSNSIMVALSPYLLLEIHTDSMASEELISVRQNISSEKLEEYRKRTIGNTFREIIGEREQLEAWKASPEFQVRTELMRDVQSYNTMLRAEGGRELWSINSFGNRL